MELDLTKPVQTRGGSPARIVCTDAIGVDGPLVVLIETPSGEEFIHRYPPSGRYSQYATHSCDIINVPVKHKREFWINEYSDGTSHRHHTRDQAAKCAGAGRIACVHVTYEFEEGEGL